MQRRLADAKQCERREQLLKELGEGRTTNDPALDATLLFLASDPSQPSFENCANLAARVRALFGMLNAKKTYQEPLFFCRHVVGDDDQSIDLIPHVLTSYTASVRMSWTLELAVDEPVHSGRVVRMENDPHVFEKSQHTTNRTFELTMTRAMELMEHHVCKINSRSLDGMTSEFTWLALDLPGLKNAESISQFGGSQLLQDLHDHLNA
ncbi:MAG: hypothetical protein NT003_00120 [Candidatus Magasanikbacteria bacterium]|nr:hypothetical protein [Candidatus Magasanikbacteria bacterium]